MIFKPFDIYALYFARKNPAKMMQFESYIQQVIILEHQRTGGQDRVRVLKLADDHSDVVFCWLTIFPTTKYEKVGHLEIDEALTRDQELVRKSAKAYFEKELLREG